MVIDSLNHLDKYISLHPKFKEVFQYLNDLEWSSLSVGRINVNDDFYINVDCVDMRAREIAFPEVHYDYIDIQIPLDAIEFMGYDSSSKGYTLRKSDLESDIEFFQEIPNSILKVQPGEFVIFFPGEVHAPIIGEGKIKKLVVKVRAIS